MSELICVLWPLVQAAGGRPERSLREATWWLVGLLLTVLVAFVIAGVIIFIVRDRTMRNEAGRTKVPLTLADLRRMHRDGEIDDEEMETLKKVITEQTRRELEPPGEEE